MARGHILIASSWGAVATTRDHEQVEEVGDVGVVEEFLDCLLVLDGPGSGVVGICPA